MSALSDILDREEIGLSEEQKGALTRALHAREDAMAGIFFLAAQQFGMFPQIVAEVIAEAGLGTPPSEAEREIIRQNFTNLMEEVQRHWREQHGEGGDPT